MTTALLLIENKDTGLSVEPPEKAVKLIFNNSRRCILCGHRPGLERPEGECCICVDCICCTTSEEES